MQKYAWKERSRVISATSIRSTPLQVTFKEPPLDVEEKEDKSENGTANGKTEMTIATTTTTTAAAAARQQTPTRLLTKSLDPGTTSLALSLSAAAAVNRVGSPSPQAAKGTVTSSTNNASEPVGKYVNWASRHGTLAAQPWCCIGDLMAFCDKYEYKSIATHDHATHNRIVNEVKALLNGQAPFDMRKRFPGNIHSPENLWVCIGRCTGVEYHLNRILSAFRRPLDKLMPDKQRIARQNFHLAVNELRLDISARISEVRLYDRLIFEKDFQLEWQDGVE